MGTNLSIRRQVPVAFGAGEGELGAAVGTDLVVVIERIATVRTQIRATGGAFLVLLSDRFTTIGAELRPLSSGLRLLFGFYSFVLKTLFQFRTATGANRGIGGDLFVALGAVEAELGSTIRTDRIIRVHLCPTLGAVHLVIHLCIVESFVVQRICGHRIFLASRLCRPGGRRKKAASQQGAAQVGTLYPR
jgi:hypothetical protein